MWAQKFLILAIVSCCALDSDGAATYRSDDDGMHATPNRREKRSTARYSDDEIYASHWYNQAQDTLASKLRTTFNYNKAKNIILFLGDGMSIPTLAATRIYIGQKNNETGEEVQLSFDQFPHTALSKTYCVDSQVADSACTATAYLCGIKANEATIGVSAQVTLGDCEAATDESTHVYSIGRWAQLAGKRTGIVTTTRVTHASPAGVYAHIAHRDYESDADVEYYGNDPAVCSDIAYQAVFGETGSNLNVLLGGGRAKFLPNNFTDEEGSSGSRNDGKNLIDSWLEQKEGQAAEYVWNREELLNISDDTDYLLGLFESSHCQYHLDANLTTEPTLAEMTEAAIKVLNKGDDGFFLFVEGGRIDHAHHGILAKKAVDETEQFSLAIAKALEILGSDDTLIVVTSDHAHTMSISGYPRRGNDILGIAGTSDVDSLPYATLSYANGPVFQVHENGTRYNLSNYDMSDKEYQFPVAAPLSSETHGGDDVGIFAIGPYSHLFSGVVEQNLIPHIMAYAACVGDGVQQCEVSSAVQVSLNLFLGVFTSLALLLKYSLEL